MPVPRHPELSHLILGTVDSDLRNSLCSLQCPEPAMAEALVPPLTDDPVGVLSSGPLLNLTRANLACGVVPWRPLERLSIFLMDPGV